MVFFCAFTNGLVKRYPEIFDGDGDQSQYQINFGKKWKGYSTIVELAGGDIERIDDIVLQPLEKCLLLLAYKADKGVLEGLLHKEIMNRSRNT